MVVVFVAKKQRRLRHCCATKEGESAPSTENANKYHSCLRFRHEKHDDQCYDDKEHEITHMPRARLFN